MRLAIDHPASVHQPSKLIISKESMSIAFLLLENALSYGFFALPLAF